MSYIKKRNQEMIKELEWELRVLGCKQDLDYYLTI